MSSLSFFDYSNAVDAALEKFFGRQNGAASVAPYRIAGGFGAAFLPCLRSPALSWLSGV